MTIRKIPNMQINLTFSSSRSNNICLQWFNRSKKRWTTSKNMFVLIKHNAYEYSTSWNGKAFTTQTAPYINYLKLVLSFPVVKDRVCMFVNPAEKLCSNSYIPHGKTSFWDIWHNHDDKNQ